LGDAWSEVLSERSQPWESDDQLKSKLVLLQFAR
jgi:hypothetical protein